MGTDVLVSTGSSFSLMSAEIGPSTQIVLMMPPKEALRNQGPHVIQTYNRGDALMVTAEGTIIREDIFARLLRNMFGITEGTAHK